MRTHRTSGSIKSLLQRMCSVIVLGVVVLPLAGSSAAYAVSGTVSATTDSQAQGAVSASSAMVLPPALAAIATARRITYISTDVNGKPILVTGAVITPIKKVANAKVVAWAHGTTGYNDNCAPSNHLDVFWPEAVDAVKSYIQKGWTVAATDYAGLGGPGAQPYLIGSSEGRAVIDSVRAAHFLDPSLSKDWIASGHSQGGQAALYAGQMASSYGFGLNLKAVVGIAPVSNVDIIAQNIAGTPGQGYLVMGLYGLAAVDSTVKPLNLLAAPARAKVGVLTTGCYDEILNAFAPLTADQLLVGGKLPDSIIAKLAKFDNPAQVRSIVPALLVQGTADESVPADLTAYLQQQICAYGTKTKLVYVQGADHIGSVTQSIGTVSKYISDSFAGVAAPSNCPSQT